ncbi:MAG: hypothetical protein ACTSRK_14290 [Promethearchaeota archaeon]
MNSHNVKSSVGNYPELIILNSIKSGEIDLNGGDIVLLSRIFEILSMEYKNIRQ